MKVVHTKSLCLKLIVAEENTIAVVAAEALTKVGEAATVIAVVIHSAKNGAVIMKMMETLISTGIWTKLGYNSVTAPTRNSAKPSQQSKRKIEGMAEE